MGLMCLAASAAQADRTTEFCLDGEFDLGLRYQGMRPVGGEFYPTTWCVITEDDSRRVSFSASGKANPDMGDSWAIAYPTSDIVRIVNRAAPPDVEFRGTNSAGEAVRVRRLDPRRLYEEFGTGSSAPIGSFFEFGDGRVLTANFSTLLPLRGRVRVSWLWDWEEPEHPRFRLTLDGEALFRGTGRWRDLSAEEASTVWAATPGGDPVQVPGERWPAEIRKGLIDLTDDVYLVRGVRTGFQHLVIDTADGLVIADAPAGWVEFHHLPPADLVGHFGVYGLGVSGLSEAFVDFLKQEFPERPMRAVALTHFHDDHAGGARAFLAEGAEVFATTSSAEFLSAALAGPGYPEDRLSQRALPVRVTPVDDELTLGDDDNRVRIVSIGGGPHAYAMLGVWAVDRDYFFVSDVHVPRSEADAPGENRAMTECWFARWAVANLSTDVRVVNSHSTPVTPVSRLSRYLESDACRVE